MSDSATLTYVFDDPEPDDPAQEAEAYTELVIEFHQTCERFAGFFDHVSGVGEPPHGPEYEIIAVWKGREKLSPDHFLYKAASAWFESPHGWDACVLACP